MVKLSYAELIDEIDALKAFIPLMDRSLARGADWLVRQFAPHGPITGLRNVSYCHKVSWGLYEAGRITEGVRPWTSSDPDTSRVWWTDAGVHQNLAFAVHPDPVSGMHCWHQVVKVERAGADDRYGDVFVDTDRAHAVYLRWKALCRPAPGPGNLRRPLWFPRVARPRPDAYVMRAQENGGKHVDSR